jgi:hypothetical protein
MKNTRELIREKPATRESSTRERGLATDPSRALNDAGTRGHGSGSPAS